MVMVSNFAMFILILSPDTYLLLGDITNDEVIDDEGADNLMQQCLSREPFPEEDEDSDYSISEESQST